MLSLEREPTSDLVIFTSTERAYRQRARTYHIHTTHTPQATQIANVFFSNTMAANHSHHLNAFNRPTRFNGLCPESKPTPAPFPHALASRPDIHSEGRHIFSSHASSPRSRHPLHSHDSRMRGQCLFHLMRTRRHSLHRSHRRTTRTQSRQTYTL